MPYQHKQQQAAAAAGVAAPAAAAVAARAAAAVAAAAAKAELAVAAEAAVAAETPAGAVVKHYAHKRINICSFKSQAQNKLCKRQKLTVSKEKAIRLLLTLNKIATRDLLF